MREEAGRQVHKFGGASLADGAAMRHAASIVVSRAPATRVVVVSAIAGATDALLEAGERALAGEIDAAVAIVDGLHQRYGAMARELLAPGADAVEADVDGAFCRLREQLRGVSLLRELTPRTRDALVSWGERLSARLFAATLAAAGQPAEYVDATEVVRTRGGFGGAAPDLDATDAAIRDRLGPLLDAGVVPVVPGFIGATPDGEVATLGRGGSDLTATLLGRALAPAAVSLWKDVPGLLTADPRLVPEARVVPQLHLREAGELAYYGAKVLHPRALIPVSGREVPVFVRPFAEPAARGTEISARRTLADYPVKALTAVGGQALVTVAGNGMLGVPGIAARTFAALGRAEISVSLITQASSEHSICCAVPEPRAEDARVALLEAFRAEIASGEIDGIEVRPGLATLAVVGLGMAGTPGVAARVFGALAAGGINIVAIAQGSSELNISVVVGAAEVAAAQRLVHAEFHLGKIGGGRLAAPGRRDVVLLGFGQVGRALAGLVGRRRGDVAGVNLVAVIDRSGFVFDPRGLAPRRLAELALAKQAGRPLAELPGGRAASAAEALAWITGHALSRPVLVDVTAGETGAMLRVALAAGLDVALANKRPLAGPVADVDSLRLLARRTGRRIGHEATVGAGLPVIDTFHKLVESGDRVLRIDAASSGTLGFLLTEIEDGRPFSEALRRAMALGYTEPDPRDDLSGADVARKALILGRLLGFDGDMAQVPVESLVPEAFRDLPLPAFLERLEELDPLWERRRAAARARGGALRYLAAVTRRRIRVGLRVVSADSPFAGLRGPGNQFVFTTAHYRENPLVITGPGAGPTVTAAGVLNDILRAV